MLVEGGPHSRLEGEGGVLGAWALGQCHRERAVIRVPVAVAGIQMHQGVEEGMVLLGWVDMNVGGPQQTGSRLRVVVG